MSEIYEDIMRKHYDNVLHYCNARLNGNVQAAKDCTQEVFLILYQKMNKLNLSLNIQGWLYQTADREIKAYIRKHPMTVDIDEVPEQVDETAFIGDVNILDELTEEERQLTVEYYSGEDKNVIAQRNGITLSALYSRIRNIKQKLRKLL